MAATINLLYVALRNSALKTKIIPHCRILERNISKSTCRMKYAKFTTPNEAVLSEQGAKDFIFRLTAEERVVLLSELELFQAAALKLDPKGTPPPSTAQLKAVAAHNALPFIGFGFLDNFIMIIAGDYIDATIGITLGISTMAAAGLGNTLSDIAGIGSAWYVEVVATKVGVQPPNLTPAQVDMTRTRWSANLGRALGVTIGCLLGMFPLLFMNTGKEEKEKKEKEKDEPKS